MENIDTIKKKNEELEQRFTAIETVLASMTDAKELFENVLTKLEEEFAIPFVWISMINRPGLPEAIHDLTSSNILKYRLNIIKESAFRSLIADDIKPILINNDLNPFYKLMPLKKKYFIRSLAVVPITLHHEIIGSLNLADASSLRYHPDMDTTLLQRLGSSLSCRLSEMIPCEKAAESSLEEMCKNE
jgi:uncharacterized protein YigA (DUF484 family)